MLFLSARGLSFNDHYKRNVITQWKRYSLLDFDPYIPEILFTIFLKDMVILMFKHSYVKVSIG